MSSRIVCIEIVELIFLMFGLKVYKSQFIALKYIILFKTITSFTTGYRYTYLLTSRSRVLLEKLTGSAASQEIPRSFETRRFLTIQVPATCPYPEPTPSSAHNPLPLPEDPS